MIFFLIVAGACSTIAGLIIGFVQGANRADWKRLQMQRALETIAGQGDAAMGEHDKQGLWAKKVALAALDSQKTAP